VSSDIEVKVGNAFSLPIADSSTDLISYFHVLEHILDVDSILIEATRVLKENGHILVEVPDANNYGQEQNRLGSCYCD
jgi:ubiquinone/menaquinone biosynthesis C-methylase UbiE